MILSILTGGIDLPKLNTRVLNLDTQHATTMSLLSNTVAAIYGARGIVGKEDRQFGDPYETRYESLSDRLDAIENLIASRALAEDVETLRMKLERVEGSQDHCVNLKDHLALAIRVDALTKQIDALTNAKLAEVKARKAPKKDAAK